MSQSMLFTPDDDHEPEAALLRQRRAVYRSERWRWLVDLRRFIVNDRCEDCRQAGLPLQGHHMTYERLGRERITDLVVVCGDCHLRRHQRRRRPAVRRPRDNRP